MVLLLQVVGMLTEMISEDTNVTSKYQSHRVGAFKCIQVVCKWFVAARELSPFSQQILIFKRLFKFPALHTMYPLFRTCLSNWKFSSDVHSLRLKLRHQCRLIGCVV